MVLAATLPHILTPCSKIYLSVLQFIWWVTGDDGDFDSCDDKVVICCARLQTNILDGCDDVGGS